MKNDFVNPAVSADLEPKRSAVAALCDKYDVASLSLFGSGTSSEWDEHTSDLDFIVEFRHRTEPGLARRYLGLASELEALFGRPVDLITERSIRNPYFRRVVDAQRVVVYAA